MNKRGQLPLIPIILIVVVIVGLIAFLASGTIRWVLIGVGLFGGSIWLISTVNNDRIKLSFGLVLLLAAVALIFSSGFLQQALEGADYINVPTVGYYECAAASAPTVSAAKAISGGIANGIMCPPNTDKCDLIVSFAESQSVFSSRKLSYVVYGSDSKVLYRNVLTVSDAARLITIFDATTRANVPLNSIKIDNIAKGQKVDIQYSKVNLVGTVTPIDGASYRAQFNPFILWNNPGLGGRFEYTSIEQGCQFLSKDRGNLIVEDTIGKGPGTSNSITTLEPFKTRNYLDVIVPVNIQSNRVQQYSGNTVYCQNAQLHPIENVRALSHEYNVVRFDKSVATVDCCNGDDRPGYQCASNKWKALPKPNEPISDKNTVQCSAVKPCANAFFAPSSGETEQTRYVCQNSVCVPETRTVECNTNAGCGGAKPVCDTLTYKCVSAPLPVETGKNTSSVASECELKAKKNPFAGYTVVTRTKTPTTSQKILTVATFGIVGDLNPTVETSCEAKYVPYFIFGSFIVVAVALVIWSFKGSKGKR